MVYYNTMHLGIYKREQVCPLIINDKLLSVVLGEANNDCKTFIAGLMLLGMLKHSHTIPTKPHMSTTKFMVRWNQCSPLSLVGEHKSPHPTPSDGDYLAYPIQPHVP